jgi:uncharacterized protein DUF6184
MQACAKVLPPSRRSNGGTVNIALKTGLCAVSLTFAAACGKSDRPAESALAEAVTTEGGSATESIAEARCARESRCDNVGPEKTYSSMEDCIIRVRSDWSDELSARECKAGVNETQLNECLNEVREEECSSPFDTLERVAACTTGQICAD